MLDGTASLDGMLWHDFMCAISVLVHIVKQQPTATPSSSSSNAELHKGGGGRSSADADEQQQQQQQGCEPPWLLPLLLTSIDVATAWPVDAKHRFTVAAECVKLLGECVSAAAGPAAAGLAAQLLPHVTGRFSHMVLQARQCNSAGSAQAAPQQADASGAKLFSGAYAELLDQLLLAAGKRGRLASCCPVPKQPRV
jgi:hypothetical protein